MGNDCAQEHERAEDELEINSGGGGANTERTYTDSDSINYKSLIEI